MKTSLAAKRVWTLVGAALAVLATIVVRQAMAEDSSRDAAGGGADAPGGMPAPTVEVVAAAMKELPRVTELVSRVESPNTVEIRARVEGYLEKQLFSDGALVKKGQSLFLIEQKNYVIALKQARADLAKARATLQSARKGVEVLRAKAEYMASQAKRILSEKDLARIKPLAETGAVSKQVLDEAVATNKAELATEDAMLAAYQQAQINQATDIQLGEAAVEAAEAAVDSAQLNLSYTDVKSPIDGRVGSAQQLPGALVGKDMTAPTLLATVSPINPMRATWSISEQEYLSLVGNGSPSGLAGLSNNIEKIEMILADNQIYNHPGVMNFVDRAIDPKTGTLMLRGDFPNPDGILREGQYCRVRITRRASGASLVIPQRALLQLQGESFVYVVKPDSSVEQRKVQLGERIGSEQVILSGLKAGERVVVSGTQSVQPGGKVLVSNGPAAQPSQENRGI